MNYSRGSSRIDLLEDEDAETVVSQADLDLMEDVLFLAVEEDGEHPYVHFPHCKAYLVLSLGWIVLFTLTVPVALGYARPALATYEFQPSQCKVLDYSIKAAQDNDNDIILECLAKVTTAAPTTTVTTAAPTTTVTTASMTMTTDAEASTTTMGMTPTATANTTAAANTTKSMMTTSVITLTAAANIIASMMKTMAMAPTAVANTTAAANTTKSKMTTSVITLTAAANTTSAAKTTEAANTTIATIVTTAAPTTTVTTAAPTTTVTTTSTTMTTDAEASTTTMKMTPTATANTTAAAEFDFDCLVRRANREAKCKFAVIPLCFQRPCKCLKVEVDVISKGKKMEKRMLYDFEDTYLNYPMCSISPCSDDSVFDDLFTKIKVGDHHLRCFANEHAAIFNPQYRDSHLIVFASLVAPLLFVVIWFCLSAYIIKRTWRVTKQDLKLAVEFRFNAWPPRPAQSVRASVQNAVSYTAHGSVVNFSAR